MITTEIYFLTERDKETAKRLMLTEDIYPLMDFKQDLIINESYEALAELKEMEEQYNCPIPFLLRLRL